MKAFAVMAVVVALAGCSSINTANKTDLNGQKLTLTKAQDIKHVHGSSWGLYFLIWPLLTGSTDHVGNIAVLQDTVKVDKVVSMVTAEGKRLGAKNMVDMKSSRGGAGFIFYINEVQVSANAIK